MARNTSGTHSLPSGNPVAPTSTIASAWANSTLGDISTEITDSLSRSGKGGMTAPLRCADGTVAAPAHSFTSETGSGWFRHAAGELRLAILGVYRLAVTATTTTINSALSVASTIFSSGTITATGALISKSITSAKLLSVKAPDTLAADYEITLPAALPGSTLPVTMTSAGVLATGQLVNAQQNFGTPSAATDVVIKSYVDATVDSPTVASGDIAITQLKVTNSLGRVLVHGRIVFGATAYASNTTFLTLSSGYRPHTNFIAWLFYVKADGTTIGLASVGFGTDGTLKFSAIHRTDDWSGTSLLSTTAAATLHVAVEFPAA